MVQSEETVTLENEQERVEEFKDEMSEVRISTNDDGYVEATVQSVVPTEDGDEIRVEFLLPSGDVYSELMHKPERETDEYKFVRLCSELGATIDTFDELLVGSTIEVDRIDSGEWEIIDPSVESSFLSQRFKQLRYKPPKSADEIADLGTGRYNQFIVGCILFPLTAFLGLVSFFDGDKKDIVLEYFSVGVFLGTVTTLVYVGLFALLLGLI